MEHKMNIAGLERYLPLCKVTDELYIGAALGCAIGIMRSRYGKDLFRMNTKLDEIAAAVRWQRFAPPFSGGELKVSDKILFALSKR